MLDSAVRDIFTGQSEIRNRKFGGLVRSGPVRLPRALKGGFFKDRLTATLQTKNRHAATPQICRKVMSFFRRFSLAIFSVPIRIAAIDVQYLLWLHVLSVLKSKRFKSRGNIHLSSAFKVAFISLLSG
jgi:hypothetical protein